MFSCKSQRRSLLVTTVLATSFTVLGAGHAFAQEALQSEPVATVDEIVVTGSRIPRPNLEQPTPVATVSRETIEYSGTQNLGDIIAELPALSANSTVRGNSDSFGDDGGLNFANLRNLGASRTLTLVDGKRHVGGDAGNAAVDLNAVPAALVERVEVITGGASAVYGSDAVSGVVNIILKDDFEGGELTIQTAGSEDGPGKTYSVNGVYGRNFLDGRLNATVSGFFDRSDRVMASDIRGLRNWGTILNPADPSQDPNNGIPNRVIVPNVLTDYLDENGVILDWNTLDIISALTRNGMPTPQSPRLGDNSFAFGQFDDCETCAALDDYVTLVPKTERYGANVRLRYDLTNDITAYFDGKYVRSEIFDSVQPSFTFGDYLIEADNAFITPEIAAVVAGREITFGRFNEDIGARTNDITRETYRAVVGVRGRTDTNFADFNWDLSYNYGETQNAFRGGGNTIPGNYQAAIDSVVAPDGTIQCRVNVPSAQGTDYAPPEGMTSDTCVPFNPFGRQNSQAAIDYVSHESLRTHTITQEVVTGLFNFDTGKFFNLPGGPLAFAGGFEYRKETSENINDEFVKSGLSETAPQPDAFGEFDVTEGFVEFNAPLLADAPFAYRLSVDGAYRYADYSTVGGAEAWKVGAIYAPVRDVTFRGTYSRAVRAPNITEAFLPATAGFFSVTDPCDVNNIQQDPDRVANCAAAGVPTGFNSNTNASIEGVSSGNANLNAEKAKSWTAGVVLQPRWVPGLSFTADYYDIQIDDAISLISAQNIINNCYDGSGGLDDNFCSLFTRGADGNIDFVSTTYVNAAALNTKGWDFELAYTRDLGALAETNPVMFGGLRGRVTGVITANYLDELNFFAFADRPDEINLNKGEIGNPEWSFKTRLAWSDGPLSLAWETRYEDRVARFETTPQPGINRPESIFPNYVPAQTYHDISVRYRFEQLGWGTNGVEVFAGVNNITDRQIPYGLSGNGTSSTYDLFGRQFFGGIRARF
jgi:iron complex outermembrane recepter protein